MRPLRVNQLLRDYNFFAVGEYIFYFLKFGEVLNVISKFVAEFPTFLFRSPFGDFFSKERNPAYSI